MLSRDNKTCLLTAVGVLVLLPAAHVLLYGMAYFQAISQILTMAVTALWMLSVEKRVISGAARRYLRLAGLHLIVYLFATVIKQKCFIDNADMVRYIWYSSYVPMTAVPLYTFYISVNTGRDAEGTAGKWHWLRIPELLLIAGVMTNDLTRFAFDFPQGIELGEHKCTHEILYWAVFAWNICLYVCALVTMLRNGRRMIRKRFLWIPLIPLFMGGAFFLTDVINTDLVRVNGSRVLSVSEVFVLMVLGFLEGCIQTGLIPSNSMYNRFFAGASVPAVIRNAKGRTFYTTSAPWPYGDGEIPEEAPGQRTLPGGIRLRRVPVSGGSLIFGEDLSSLEALEESVRVETEQIEERNGFLARENELREENARLKAKNEVYDRIEEQVREQRDRLAAVMEKAERSDEDGFREQLALGCVISAYIKRRSNMELLAAEQDGAVPVMELVSAVAESLEYAKLCGMETVLLPCADRTGTVPLKEAAVLYEGLEAVLEDAAGRAKFFTAGAYPGADGQISLRIMVSPARALTERLGGAVRRAGCDAAVTEDGGDMNIRLTAGGGTA